MLFIYLFIYFYINIFFKVKFTISYVDLRGLFPLIIFSLK